MNRQSFQQKHTPMRKIRWDQTDGCLLGKDAKKLIENDISDWFRYRIPTHPDLVTYNRENLLKHTDSGVRELARKLRKDGQSLILMRNAALIPDA